jgi:hypothetical protein
MSSLKHVGCRPGWVTVVACLAGLGLWLSIAEEMPEASPKNQYFSTYYPPNVYPPGAWVAWSTPVDGLAVGAALIRDHRIGQLTLQVLGKYQGTNAVPWYLPPMDLRIAAEWCFASADGRQTTIPAHRKSLFKPRLARRTQDLPLDHRGLHRGFLYFYPGREQPVGRLNLRDPPRIGEGQSCVLAVKVAIYKSDTNDTLTLLQFPQLRIPLACIYDIPKPGYGDEPWMSNKSSAKRAPPILTTDFWIGSGLLVVLGVLWLFVRNHYK